ncbi:zinc-dependent metalloprotease [Nocardioides bruguierae]|uniref:zinc-dependent metalloprotease n=1 Tax=Nocardioides bruguierae TaxID=2945102 RepID=UPI0020219AD1|nr:zinc-dependent metalloprotease [Nocardioides bruguierae]MCL8026171.1 zinc-dependent metalloprotease [Nocardioides bruguierae]
MTSTASSPEMIDWDLAVSLGGRLAGDGPTVTPAQARRAVGDLRNGAERATDLVRAYTGLDGGRDTAPVLVVDRPGWVQANADAFRHVLGPVAGRLAQRKPPGRLSLAVGSKITGTEVGGLLGFLAGKVLGQFDPFHEPHGRLLLVAPNIVHTERELDVAPRDFRLWVCLHEETHRVQFTAVPWMRDHLFGLVERLSASLEDTSAIEDGLKRVTSALKQRGGGDQPGPGGALSLLATPEQKAVMDDVTAVMSLLEGHADVVMDGVGPEVVPTVDTIRARFNERRKGVGVLDRALRRFLGLDAKMAQYRDGAVFVRHVVDTVGMDGFNAVWSGPASLPTRDEIADPALWVARVHG